MIDKAAILLMMGVLVVSVSLGMKEDIAHGTPLKHGKQDHLNKDGSHNVHFDHEAILGSYKLEEEFDDLEPDESKRRLRLLVKKMDKDEDGFVSRQELIDWILMSFRLLDEEEAIEEMDEIDKNGDGKISWQEYLDTQFNYNDDDIEEFRSKNDKEAQDALKQVDGEEKKFAAADTNADGHLERSEFNAFYHPYSYEHMHKFELDRTMAEHDKNKDGLLSVEEFISEAGDDKEWIAVEKDRFKDYDTNKDGYLDYGEIRPWVLTDNQEEAQEEADHLLQEGDENQDGRLSEDEIVEKHEQFVGSQVTDYGRHLYFIKHKDEL